MSTPNTLDERNDPTTPTATLQIYNFIETYLGREESTHVNRASSATLCYKRRWYQRNGYKGEQLTPRKIVNFTLGDLTEHTVKYFISRACVGEGKIYSEVDFGKPTGAFTIQNGKEITIYDQETLTAYIGGITVTAHVDGWGKRNSDGKWELIEVKSAADYGYDSFKENGPGDYLKQASVCLQTNKAKELGAKEVRYFYLKKNTGHIFDRLHAFDDELARDVVEEFKLANQDNEPIAPYRPIPETYRKAPTGRKVLQWYCNYCPYPTTCHKNAVMEFKNGKPLYVISQTKQETE
jgi:hypothetical protein